MPINRLNHIWFERIEQLWSHLRVTQRRNLTHLLVGIYLGKSVALNTIAIKIPGQAVEVSTQRRVSRFLGNPAICVRTCYDPLIEPLLAQISRHGQVRLLVDGTKVGNGHQLLMVRWHTVIEPFRWLGLGSKVLEDTVRLENNWRS